MLVGLVMQKWQREMDSKSTIYREKQKQKQKLAAELFPCFLYIETRGSKETN